LALFVQFKLDPRSLNVAIKREFYQLPTIEDITRMYGAKWFSKVDANQGYWQLKLDEEIEFLTTFNFPFGRYCFIRMPFFYGSGLIPSLPNTCPM
jgi:hypothetical protein